MCSVVRKKCNNPSSPQRCAGDRKKKRPATHTRTLTQACICKYTAHSHEYAHQGSRHGALSPKKESRKNCGSDSCGWRLPHCYVPPAAPLLIIIFSFWLDGDMGTASLPHFCFYCWRIKETRAHKFTTHLARALLMLQMEINAGSKIDTVNIWLLQ